MTSRKELYAYLECPDCEDIFRVALSAYRDAMHIGFMTDVRGLLECPNCKVKKPAIYYETVSRRKWIKSNEVIPDKI